MTWFRVDDGFSEHAKVDALGADQPMAVAAWTMCGSACARALTDGLVTHKTLARALVSWPANYRSRAAAALVRVGLWVEDPEGWRFHDWEAFQPSRVTVEARREDGKQRKAEHDERKRNALLAAKRAEEEQKGNALPLSPSDALPSRPVPSRPVPALSRSQSAREVPHLGHLLSEAKRVLGKAWVSERTLLDAWDGGGMRAVHREVAEAKKILDVLGSEADPDAAITRALEGFKVDAYAAANGRSMSLFAREPGRYLTTTKHPSAVSEFKTGSDGRGIL